MNAARAVETAVVTARTTTSPATPNLQAMKIDDLRIAKGSPVRLAKMSTDATLGLADVGNASVQTVDVVGASFTVGSEALASKALQRGLAVPYRR